MLERCDVLYVCVCGEYLFYPDAKLMSGYSIGRPVTKPDIRLINRVPANQQDDFCYACSLIFYHVEHIDLRDLLWKKSKKDIFMDYIQSTFPLERNAQVIRH